MEKWQEKSFSISLSAVSLAEQMEPPEPTEEGGRELFDGYRVLVLQDKKNPEECSHNNVSA